MSAPRDVLSRTLPTEVWFMIMEHLPEPYDLSSLAQVSKRLYSIVKPNHLSYRSICAFTDESCLWDALSNNRVNAECVRRLMVSDRREVHLDVYKLHWRTCKMRIQWRAKFWRCPIPALCFYRIPSPVMPGLEEEAAVRVSRLPVAIFAMHRLQEVCLCIWANQLDSFGGLFGSLGSSVERLEVHVTESGSSFINAAYLSACQQAVGCLRGGYRAFYLTCMLDVEVSDSILDSFAGVLVHRCPALEDISIRISAPPEDAVPDVEPAEPSPVVCEALWNGEWPELRFVATEGVSIHSLGFHNFCLRHPSLYVLHLLGTHDENPPSVPNDALPLLVEIATDVLSEFLKSLFEPMNDGAYRPIEQLGIHLSGYIASELQDIEELGYRAGRLQSLIHLSVTCRDKAGPQQPIPKEFFAALKILGVYLPNVRALKVTTNWLLKLHFPWEKILSRYPALQEADIGWMSDAAYYTVPEGMIIPAPELVGSARLAALQRLEPGNIRLLRVDDWAKEGSGDWQPGATLRRW